MKALKSSPDILLCTLSAGIASFAGELATFQRTLGKFISAEEIGWTVFFLPYFSEQKFMESEAK